jgi:hypothetical protein
MSDAIARLPTPFAQSETGRMVDTLARLVSAKCISAKDNCVVGPVEGNPTGVAELHTALPLDHPTRTSARRFIRR